MELISEKYRDKQIPSWNEQEEREDLLPSLEHEIVNLLLEYGRLRLEQVPALQACNRWGRSCTLACVSSAACIATHRSLKQVQDDAGAVCR